MIPGTAESWRILARILKIAGGACCVFCFSCLLVLIGVYDSNRPHAPQPDRGWTVGLSWTHPLSYGTPQEENDLLLLHWLFFPSFTLAALGEAIKIYKLNDYSGVAAIKKLPFLRHD